MINFWRKREISAVAGLLVIFLLTVYRLTLANGLILGDPTEYTFVANTLSIAHPPGYALITLVGWLFQTLIPFGDYPFRMHLLAATSGVIASLAVYLAVVELSDDAGTNARHRPIGALFAGLVAGLGTNVWQHSIHANPHIMTATFMVVNLFLLLRWGNRFKRGESTQGWLLLFCLSAGLGATHHPLTVFSFPAYTLYILVVHWRILLDWKTLLQMVGVAFIGLLPFLYYPIRSPQNPPFGPNTMNTLDGFLAHVLARGLAESLPYYSLAEQPIRQIVFWSIMRLQYGWPIVILAVIGVIALFRGQRWRAGLLILGTFAMNYGFVITLKQQDIMAYILGPLLIIALLSGVGLSVWVRATVTYVQDHRARLALIVLAFAVAPLPQFLFNVSRISLRSFDEGDHHVETVFTEFEGGEEGIVLLNNWEFMTPLWYTQFVDARWPDPADVRPEFVSAAEPWLPSVFNYLPGGPVYINSYRREIVDAGFRLRPVGDFYQVVEPGDTTLPDSLTRLDLAGDGIHLVGYELPQTTVAAGEFVPLALAMSLPAETADFYAPILNVGEVQFAFTTDTHLITPLWLPDEVIVERFDFALPHHLPAGDYPLTVTIQNLSQNGADAGFVADLGTLTVVESDRQPHTDDLLANYRHRVGLRSATAWDGLSRSAAPWDAPISAAPGDAINVMLNWEALDYAEESYTIFVHLIDPGNQLYVALDYTPLGGATPTHLWFPKWLPDQRMTDPYRLVVPPDLAPGTYLIEVGLYEMTSGRRLHMHDESGNLIGDRYILGAVDVR